MKRAADIIPWRFKTVVLTVLFDPRRQHFLNAQKRENREHKKGESTCTSQSASRSERLKSGQNMS